MGNADSATKAYTKDNYVFADIFNYFYGKKLVDPKNLTPVDSEEIFLSTKGKRKKKADNLQQFRDVIKRLTVMKDENAIYVLLGVESQTHIHYAMPIRVMLYDSLRYYSQLQSFSKKYKQKGAKEQYHLSDDEFLSGFRKDDKILPIITVVVYFGVEPWDGPRALSDMCIKTELTSRIQDYKITIIEPSMDLSELEKLESSLKEVMMYIKYSSDKDKLKKLLEENENYSHLDKDAANVLLAITNTELPENSELEGGKINMCKAIEDMKQESREEGLQEGLLKGLDEGINKGVREGILSSIVNLTKSTGWSFDKVVSVLQVPEVDINYYKERLNQLN